MWFESARYPVMICLHGCMYISTDVTSVGLETVSTALSVFATDVSVRRCLHAGLTVCACAATDMRMGRDQQWQQMQQRYAQHGGSAPFGMGSGVSPMPPSSGSYSMYNRAGHRMSPQRAGKMQVRHVVSRVSMF